MGKAAFGNLSVSAKPATTAADPFASAFSSSHSNGTSSSTADKWDAFGSAFAASTAPTAVATKHDVFDSAFGASNNGWSTTTPTNGSSSHYSNGNGHTFDAFSSQNSGFKAPTDSSFTASFPTSAQNKCLSSMFCLYYFLLL